MPRITGLRADVTVNGITATYMTGWTMTFNADILSHRGASEDLPTLYPLRSPRAGSFDCEADPTDAVQAALMSGLQRQPLTLYEDDGTLHNFDALIWPSVSMPRDGKPTRTFSYRETA